MTLGEKKEYNPQATTHCVTQTNWMGFDDYFCLFLHFEGPSKDPWRKSPKVC